MAARALLCAVQAMLLRNALTQKTADAVREVYCWRTVNCLELWAHVLAVHAAKAELQPLVYPVAQLLLGAARLVPSPRWFPLRLRLVRAANALGAATGHFMPTAPVVLEVLTWPELAKPARGTGACPDLLMLLRLSKTNLKVPAVQQEVITQVCKRSQHVAMIGNRPGQPSPAGSPTISSCL
jgi:nucleolar complex protein 2